VPTSRYENAQHDLDRSMSDRRDYDSRVHRLEAITENIAQGLTALTDDVRALSQIMREGNKTNWSVLATWAGVMLALIMAVGTGFVKEPLTNLTSDYEANRIYQRDINDAEEIWRRDYLREQAQIDTSQFKTIQQHTKELDEMHSRMQVISDKIASDAMNMSSLESRMQAVERILFTEARYRSGKPN